MDELFFFFILFCGLFFLASIIYCFLSTCLGIQIRRSDLKEAFSIPTPAKIRARDAERRRRMEQAGGYELDDMDRNLNYERIGGMSSNAEEFEMMRRGGPSRGFF
ncbi:uncharacterized protein L201_002107 [Kwoniella dendrophila CBS 6074]|uniref:Uncharacterized protein n=1 Tax=Kwoniella dendrophila CBS 6074 TaxID=1295534 RepID=A0AAX4JR66_9TREE